MQQPSQDAANSRSPSAAAAQFIAATEAEQLDLHSLLLLHSGVVVAEAYRAPFDADTPHRMYSVTKSFVSSAIGLAVADGLLTVEDRVVDIFPDLAPHPIDAHLGALCVKHLLTMTAEHPGRPGVPGARNTPSVAAFLAERLVLPPGSRFEYSSPSSYVLSAIVQRLTGEPLDAYLRARLLDPLGIAARPWLSSEEGVNNGGWGLHLTTRELARFGQLYLQQGIWQGQRLLSSAWVNEATSKRIASWGNAGQPDWNAGYGYQFWQNHREGYRADGLLGQFCIVLPRLDALVVTTAGTLNTQRILDLAWETLVPALDPPADAVAGGAMRAFASTPTGTAGSPRANELDGVTFVLGEPTVLPTRFYGGQAPIVSAGVALENDSVVLSLTDRDATYRLPVGTNAWSGGTSPVSTGYAEPYKALARWEAPNRLAIELVFTEGGFRLTFVFELDPLQLALKTPANPGLEGRAIVGRPFP